MSSTWKRVASCLLVWFVLMSSSTMALAQAETSKETRIPNDWAERALTDAGAFVAGAAGDLLVAELSARICDASSSALLLFARTCAGQDLRTMAQLRHRVAQDLVLWGGRVLEKQIPAEEWTGNLLKLRLALMVVEVTIDGADPASMAKRTLDLLENQRTLLSRETKTFARQLGGSARLIQALLEEVQREENPSLDEVALVQLIFAREQGIAAPPEWSEGHRRHAKKLVRALRYLKRPPEPNIDLQKRVMDDARSLSQVLLSSMALHGPEIELPETPFQILGALLDGDPRRALHHSLEILGQSVSRRSEVSPETMELVLRFVTARDLEEAKRVLRGALLGLGPWSDPWVLDANAGVPFLDLDTLDFRFAGDLTLGYQGENLGALGHGSIRAFDLATGTQLDDTTRSRAELDAWWAGDSLGGVRIEGRVAGEVSLYDTTVIPTGNRSELVFREETSLMWRGFFLGGARYERPSYALGVWAGAGFQREDYSGLTVRTFNRLEDLNVEGNGLVWELRLRSQVAVMNGVLVLRHRSDLSGYRITRSTLSVLAEVEQTRSQAQIESTNRLFVDLEWARLLGFVPSVSLGLDVISRQDEQDEVVTSVPLVGVGVRRVSF